MDRKGPLLGLDLGMEPAMRRVRIAFAVAGVACLAGGCAHSPRQVTMDVEQPEISPALTLGAGDALGWRIYQQDVFLAMRDGYSRGIYQPALFPEMRVVEVPVE